MLEGASDYAEVPESTGVMDVDKIIIFIGFQTEATVAADHLHCPTYFGSLHRPYMSFRSQD